MEDRGAGEAAAGYVLLDAAALRRLPMCNYRTAKQTETTTLTESTRVRADTSSGVYIDVIHTRVGGGGGGSVDVSGLAETSGWGRRACRPDVPVCSAGAATRHGESATRVGGHATVTSTHGSTEASDGGGGHDTSALAAHESAFKARPLKRRMSF